MRAGGGDAPLGGEEASHRTFGKIPAFEHAGFQLYEAGAITRYIDDALGLSLQPGDRHGRARMNQVLSESAGICNDGLHHRSAHPTRFFKSWRCHRQRGPARQIYTRRDQGDADPIRCRRPFP